MREILYDLASGRGKFERSLQIFEFDAIKVKGEQGSIVFWPKSRIGRHSHFDNKKAKCYRRHCEIYFSLSRNIRINGKRKIIAICRNGYHEAENISSHKKGKLYFVKLWW